MPSSIPPSFISPVLPLRRGPAARRSRSALRAPVSQRAVVCALPSKRPRGSQAPTVLNRQARFRYELLETHECGIELLGTEIKSVRAGKLNLRDGYARVDKAQLFLHNVHIAQCSFAGPAFNHDPIRPRRLLLHKKDIRKLEEKQKDTGLTLVPTKAYFSNNGYLKIEIALAKGKKLHDKRLDIKKREDDREIRRVVKQSVSRL